MLGWIMVLLLMLNGTACTQQESSKEKPQSSPNSVSTVSAPSPQKTKQVLKPPTAMENPPLEGVEYNKYKDGKKDGLWRKFYPDGQLRNEFTYSKGVKEGLCKEWDQNGNLSLEGYYQKNKANGLMKWYSELGHLAGVGNMVDDRRNGVWKVCDWKDANFCSEGTFRDDKEEGPWKSYTAEGKLARINTWKAGKIVSSRCWDKSGKEVACK